MTCGYAACMSTQPQPQSVERRKATRQKSFLRGTVHFNNRRSALDCLIRDISPYGARLIFSGSVTLPDVVELHIPQKEHTSRAHVIWRHGQEVGVAFAQHVALDGIAESGELSERVQRLEAEVAALKRLVRQIKAETAHEFEVD
jgi:hypothetical protein